MIEGTSAVGGYRSEAPQLDWRNAPGTNQLTFVDDYLARTPRSRALWERATASLPGGSTRTTVYSPPYPPYLERGAGLVVTDVDGNTYRDFLGNYTSLILGHAHPAVIAAVEAQVRRGSACPGERYDVIWTAREPGKWLLHCHINHHTTNDNVEEEGGGGLMMILNVSG